MIKNAVNHEYLVEFLDTTTYLINKPIYEVLETLYDQYGQVRRQDLKIVEREVENLTYDLTQPLSVIWKAIDDLQKLAIAAKLKYSDEQLVQLGLSIIQSTHDFEKGQDEWIDKPDEDKTYTNLKKHFNKALKKLQQIRGDDMFPAAQHHANAMRLDMNASNNSMQQDMLANVTALKEDIINAIVHDKENLQPIEPSMNAATTIDAMTKLTNAIAGLEQRVKQMETSALQTNTNNQDPNYNIPVWQRPGNRFKYCWSCGSNATHEGKDCTRRKEGHIESATFQDRKGGSTKRIPKRFQNM